MLLLCPTYVPISSLIAVGVLLLISNFCIFDPSAGCCLICLCLFLFCNILDLVGEIILLILEILESNKL
jgi:hypothetical protein